MKRSNKNDKYKKHKYNSFDELDDRKEYEDAEYAEYGNTDTDDETDKDSYIEEDYIEIEDLDDSDITDEFDETFWEKKDNFIKRLWRKRPFKIFLFIIELLLIMLLSASVALVCAENSKTKLLSALSGCSLVHDYIESLIGDDYNSTVLDTDFDEDDIETNDIELEGDYTNIAIFGVDSRNDDDATLNNNSDTIMILSINNDTKEVKIASIYRDTLVQYTTSDGSTAYDKATNVYAYGGATMLINALNTNFDLDISDYITINWSGLANIIDAFGGVDVTITDDELYWLNDYLDDLDRWTDLDCDYVTESGDVHLDGAQAVAYCRIRYVAFYYDDGTSVNNDFGRTARQRLVIDQLIENASDCSVSDLLSIAQDLFEENSEDNSFMISSLNLSEMLNLVPLLLEVDFDDGGEGFPSSYTTYYTSSGGQCLKPDTLLSTVIELHDYLFTDEEYTPSSEVTTLSEYLEALESSSSSSSSSTTAASDYDYEETTTAAETSTTASSEEETTTKSSTSTTKSTEATTKSSTSTTKSTEESTTEETTTEATTEETADD